MRTAFAIALTASASACFGADPGVNQCISDQDCIGICTRVGECAREGEALDIRLNWTINGEAPTIAAPETCGAIADFEVRFESIDPRDLPIAYFPVPCENGTVYYDKMPGRLKSVHLIATDEGGQVIGVGSRDIERQSSVFDIDFPL